MDIQENTLLQFDGNLRKLCSGGLVIITVKLVWINLCRQSVGSAESDNHGPRPGGQA